MHPCHLLHKSALSADSIESACALAQSVQGWQMQQPSIRQHHHTSSWCWMPSAGWLLHLLALLDVWSKAAAQNYYGANGSSLTSRLGKILTQLADKISNRVYFLLMWC